MDKKQKTVLILIVIGLVYIGLQIIPYPQQSNHTLFHQKNSAPLVIAHGGAKSLYPENTRYAFEEVAKMDVDVMEVDICISNDDVLLTHHDTTIDHTSNQLGNVRDYTYEQLSTFHFGYRFKDKKGNHLYRNVEEEIRKKLIPMRLEDLFIEFPDMRFILEFKNEGELGKKAVQIASKIINQYQMQKQVCVASFHQDVIDYFTTINEEGVATTLGYQKAKQFVVANLWGYGIFTPSNHEGILLPVKERGIDLVNQYLLFKVHHQGMFAYYWTINDKQTIQRLIDMGVDGIISDRPDVVKEVLKENGYT